MQHANTPRPPSLARVEDAAVSTPVDPAAASTYTVHEARRGWRLIHLRDTHHSWPLIIAVCLLWLLPGIWGREPWKPDEAYTLGIIYHFYRTHEWLVPMLGGTPFMEKPPLFFWTATVFGRLFQGLMPFGEAIRFATLFYMAMVLIFTWTTARELMPPRAARFAPLVLIACLGLIYRGHELMTDAGLLAGFALAAYGLALSQRRPRLGGLLLGLGVGVGFMCKGLIAPGIFGITFLLLPWVSPAYRCRQWWLTAVVAFITALPWLVVWPWLIYQESPTLFHNWLWVNNAGRFLYGDSMGGQYDPFYYLKILPWLTFPALPLALLAVWRQRARWREPHIAMPLLLTIITFLVLQLSRAVSDVYALPLLLPVAWLGALGLGEIGRRGILVLNTSAWLLFGLLATLLWCGWWVFVSGNPAALRGDLYLLLPRGVLNFEWLAFAAAVLCTLTWLLLPLAANLPAERALIRWITGLTLVWCLVMSLWLPALNTSKSYRGIMNQIATVTPRTQGCLASFGLGDSERALLSYYEGMDTRPFYNARALPDCKVLLVETRGSEQPGFDSWIRIWNGARPGSVDGEHFWVLVRPSAFHGEALARTPSVSYVGVHKPHKFLLPGSQHHGNQLPQRNPF